VRGCTGPIISAMSSSLIKLLSMAGPPTSHSSTSAKYLVLFLTSRCCNGSGSLVLFIGDNLRRRSFNNSLKSVTRRLKVVRLSRAAAELAWTKERSECDRLMTLEHSITRKSTRVQKLLIQMMRMTKMMPPLHLPMSAPPAPTPAPAPT